MAAAAPAALAGTSAAAAQPEQRVSTRATRRAWQAEQESLTAVQDRLQQVVRPAGAVEPVATKLAAVLVPLFAAPLPLETSRRQRQRTTPEAQEQPQERQEQPELSSGEVRVLLTRRSSHLTSHQGEVCLPGGKRDPEDADDVATALREAHEELGLDKSHAQVLGCMQPLLSKHYLSVTPVVALVPGDRALHAPQPNPDEVDEVFDVPLSLFLSKHGHSSRDISWQDVRYRIHSFEHGGQTIWGLTAAILIKVAKLAFGRDPEFQEHAPNGINYQRIWHDGQKLQVHTLAAPDADIEGASS